MANKEVSCLSNGRKSRMLDFFAGDFALAQAERAVIAFEKEIFGKLSASLLRTGVSGCFF